MRLLYSHRFAIMVSAMLALAGCGPVRYPKTYILNFPPQPPSLMAPRPIRGALTIQEFYCPEYLCEGRIVYRSSPEEIGFYEFHRWAMNPRDMITQSVANRIRSESLFNAVALKGTGLEPAYVLKGNIEQLEELDLGRDVRVVCTVSAQLVDIKAKSIIWSHTASQSIAVEDRNMAGVVGSLSVAAQLSVDELVKSLAETMPSNMAGTSN
jgi:ABC-type uncharacterized transport system auxiliary subunit